MVIGQSVKGKSVEWQNDKWAKCQTDKVSNGLSIVWTNCQIDKVPNGETVELTKWRMDIMTKKQNVDQSKNESSWF